MIRGELIMDLVKTSRFISLILRHKPEEIGITLDEHGWANVEELIRGVNIDIATLEHIVATDDKQRYSFNEDKTLIRANQGHSIPVDVELEEVQPPEFLWHGTAKKYMVSICKEGLISKSRLYVHLSPDVPTAITVGERQTFTLIGLVVSLFIIWRVFEYRSYDKQEFDEFQSQIEVMEEEMVEITKQEQPKVQPPQPKPQVTQIEIVDNEEEIEDELEIDAEVSQDEVIEVIEFTPPEIEEEEIVEAEIFKVVEEMPEFPGGPAKMMEYIQKNMKYPMLACESDIQGKVFVNFVVEPDGSISHVAVARGIGGGCDEEALRVVQSMPKWKPGKQRGSAVRVQYTVPFIFKLN